VINQVAKKLVDIPAEDRVLLESLPELEDRIWKITHVDKWYMCSMLEDLAGISLFDKLGIQRRQNKSDEELDSEKEMGQSRIRTSR
jgi:hypothetical protein